MKTMSKFFRVLACLLCLLEPGRALAAAYRIIASDVNIPTAFSTSSTSSQIGECQGNVVEIVNYTTAPLVVGFGSSTAVPSRDYSFVPAGDATPSGSIGRYKPKGGLGSGQYVYLRAGAGSAVTTGSVLISCYHEEKP